MGSDKQPLQAGFAAVKHSPPAKSREEAKAEPLPWPLPSAHDQFLYANLAIWMWFPVIFGTAGLAAGGRCLSVLHGSSSRDLVVTVAFYIWILSCTFSPLHW